MWNSKVHFKDSLSKLAFKQQLMMMLPLIFVLCRCEGVTRFFICNSVKSSLKMPNQCIWRKTSENWRLKNNPLKILFGIPTVVLKPLLKFFDLVILCLISRSINNHRWGTKSTFSRATKMHYETGSPKSTTPTPKPFLQRRLFVLLYTHLLVLCLACQNESRVKIKQK